MVAFSLIQAVLLGLAISHVQAVAIPTSASTEVAQDSVMRSEASGGPVASELEHIYERAAADQSPNPAAESKRSLQKRTNTCGNSSFINKTSSGSPSSRDCLLLQDQQTYFPQKYTVNKSTSWVTLKYFGTCVFGVKSSANYAAYVGNEDISDLLRDSLAKFTANGKVGAEGTMPCQSNSPYVWPFMSIFCT